MIRHSDVLVDGSTFSATPFTSWVCQLLGGVKEHSRSLVGRADGAHVRHARRRANLQRLQHSPFRAMGETVTSAAHRTAPRRARAPLSVRC